MATGWSRHGARQVTSRREGPRVSRLTTLLRSSLRSSLRSLGPAGAVANVQSVLDERKRQDWVVDGLVRRIETVPAAPAAASLEPAASSSAA
jgi:hypothetical protein